MRHIQKNDLLHERLPPPLSLCCFSVLSWLPVEDGEFMGKTGSERWLSGSMYKQI